VLIAVTAIPLRTRPVDIMFLSFASDRIQLCFRDCDDVCDEHLPVCELLEVQDLGC
jgi:hypothetical protein